MFKLFFASALLCAATTPVSVTELDPIQASLADHNAFLPMMAAQTDSLSLAMSESESQSMTATETQPSKKGGNNILMGICNNFLV